MQHTAGGRRSAAPRLLRVERGLGTVQRLLHPAEQQQVPRERPAQRAVQP